MMRRARDRWGFIPGVAAATLAACSNSTGPHLGLPCPTYSGGNATPAALAGNYNLVSFCQDTLPAFGPAQGVTGTLALTTGPNTFTATINIPPAPVNLAGPYTVSGDIITVTLPGALGTFTGTYAFSGGILSVSGTLPGNTPIAIVFGP